MVRELPTSSAGRLYARLAQSLFDGVAPIESHANAASDDVIASIPGAEDTWPADWWLTDGIIGSDILFADSFDFGYNLDNLDQNKVSPMNNIATK